MFISKIQLDPKKRETARALQDMGLFHSTIERSIEGERPHILWRLEPDMSIIAVSKEIPYWGDFHTKFGYSLKKPECKTYDAYINAILTGDRMRFRITVNPVINKYDGSKNGKDVPLNLRPTKKYPFCAQDWTRKKLEEQGAKILSIQDINHDIIYFAKNGKRIPIFSVTYTGILQVTNAELIKKAMIIGIGGKKTYGCGLLTAVKIN